MVKRLFALVAVFILGCAIFANLFNHTLSLQPMSMQYFLNGLNLLDYDFSTLQASLKNIQTAIDSLTFFDWSNPLLSILNYIYYSSTIIVQGIFVLIAGVKDIIHLLLSFIRVFEYFIFVV